MMQANQKPERKKSGLSTTQFFICALAGGIGIFLFLVFFVAPTPSRSETYCMEAESDAQTIVTSLVDYFADPKHTIVTPDRLIAFDPLLEKIENPWTLRVDDKGIIVRVTDRTGECSRPCEINRPEGQSKSLTTSSWDSNVFTIRIRSRDDN